ncbi:MAG: hypothetical protein H7234_06970, partial [Herminiimonas sp.]|nr:hypothetical protein [Herminiimonas sp.]
MFRTLSDRSVVTRQSNHSNPSGSATPQRPAMAPSPLAPEALRTVGRINPALEHLQQMPHRLTPLQQAIVGSIERFYENSAEPKRNMDLGFGADPHHTENLTEAEERTLERCASFLLIRDTMKGLEPLVSNILPDADITGHSFTTIAVNAVACSVKSQTERVKLTALQEALGGERLCPMTLLPKDFGHMLGQNALKLERVVDACHLPVGEREEALKPLLEQLATSYFKHSMESPGAPKSMPHKIIVSIGDSARSDLHVNLFKKKTVRLSIASTGIDRLCNGTLLTAGQCENHETLFRVHLLQGFQNHSPAKKRAALYLQLLWHELADVQRALGLRFLDEPNHGVAARKAAGRTHEALIYPGSYEFGDQVGSETGPGAQRRTVTAAMETLPDIDDSFKQRFGSSLFLDPRVGAWTQSTAYQF